MHCYAEPFDHAAYMPRIISGSKKKGKKKKRNGAVMKTSRSVARFLFLTSSHD
jgi:hypothetical protein